MGIPELLLFIYIFFFWFQMVSCTPFGCPANVPGEVMLCFHSLQLLAGGVLSAPFTVSPGTMVISAVWLLSVKDFQLALLPVRPCIPVILMSLTLRPPPLLSTLACHHFGWSWRTCFFPGDYSWPRGIVCPLGSHRTHTSVAFSGLR